MTGFRPAIALSALLLMALQPLALANDEPVSRHYDLSVDPADRITVGPKGDLSTEPQTPSALQRELFNWSEPAWCALLEDEEPIVRALVSMSLDESIECNDLGGTPDLAAIRYEAMLEGKDNPVLLTRIVEHDCMGATPARWCEDEDVLSRLTSLEPDNAYPILLTLEQRRAGNRTASLPFSGEELELLLRAASAPRVDGFYGDGMLSVHDAIERKLPSLPPLELSEKAQAIALEEGFDVSHQANEMTFSVFFNAQLSYPGAFNSLSGGCRAAAASKDEIALIGCSSLGELLVSQGMSGMATFSGRSLLRITQSAAGEPVSAEEAQNARRFEDQLLGLTVSCSMPRGLVSPDDLPGPMEPDHFRTFLSDIEVVSEQEAFRLAASREFERYPQAFPMDPSRCDEVRTLDRETLERLSQASRADGSNGRDELLNEIAQWLDSRTGDRT